MCSRSAFAFGLLLLATLAQPALAHGEDAPPGAFDPLSLALHAYLTADGALSESPPTAGAVPLPPTDAAPGLPGAPAPAGLAFVLAAPVRFVAGQGVEVALHLRAEKAVVARDADGDALELSLRRNGEAVPNATRRVPLGEPLLAPGQAASVRAILQAPGVTFAQGDEIALAVRPLMPGLQEGALFVLVGGENASTADLHDMRVPTLADLALQETNLTQFLLETEDFVPPRGASATVLRVLHDRVELAGTSGAGPSGASGPAYLVLRGEEGAAEAAAHSTPDRARRVAAAHEFHMGETLIRVHPGVGVVVPIPPGTASASVNCLRNCPEGFGFLLRMGPEASDWPRAGPEEPPSVLIPPPRSTSGIPVSKDAPEERRALPQPGLLALAALAAGAALGPPRTRWKP